MSSVGRRDVLRYGVAAGLVLVSGVACSDAPSSPRPTWVRASPADLAPLDAPPGLLPTAVIAAAPGYLLGGTTTDPWGDRSKSRVAAGAAFSENGQEWTRLASDAFPTSPGTYLHTLDSFAWFRDEFWAVGAEGEDQDADKAVIWHSPDGRAWERAAAASGLTDPTNATLATLQDKLVLLAFAHGADTSWWHSADGHTWDSGVVDLPELNRGVTTPSGLLLFGHNSNSDGESGPVVYRVDLKERRDLSPLLTGLGYPRAAASGHGRTVIVGDAETRSGAQTIPGSWVSADDGRTWEASTRFDLADTHFDASVSEACATDHGFVALGSAKSFYRWVGLLWTSEDGMTWTLVDELPGRELIAAHHGGSLIVAGETLRPSSGADNRVATVSLYREG